MPNECLILLKMLQFFSQEKSPTQWLQHNVALIHVCFLCALLEHASETKQNSVGELSKPPNAFALKLHSQWDVSIHKERLCRRSYVTQITGLKQFF